MANRGETGGTTEREQPDSADRTQPTKVPERQPAEGDDRRSYSNRSEKSGDKQAR